MAETFTREVRPKREGNFAGRTVDAKKLDFIKKIVADFQKANLKLEEREQVVVNDLGGYKPTSLATHGNKLLEQYAEATGKPVGFYFVATDHVVLEEKYTKGKMKGKNKLGQPTKLVIREGEKSKRNRSDNGSEPSE